jgi:hypothetical protein
VSSLKRLWQAIEVLPGLAAVDAEWKDLLGADYGLAQPFLRPSRELATSYPRLDGGLPYDLVVHGDDDFVGVCRDSGQSVTLLKEQLIVYELDRRLLTQRIATALEIDGTGANEAWEGRVVRLGRIVMADSRYDCFLVVPTESADIDAAASRLVAERRTPFILFCPTLRWVRSSSETRVRQQGSLLVPLAEVVASERPGILQAATPLASFIAKDREDAAAPCASVQSPDGSRNAFRFVEGVWTLRFAGKTIHLPDSLGLKCIAHLLASKGQDIDAAVLKSAAKGNTLIKPLVGIEVLDPEARKEYEAECNHLLEELEDARKFHDLAKQEQIQEKLGIIARALESATGLGGRTRKVKDEPSNVRTSVKNAINRAINNQIEPKHEALARHLDRSLRTGGTLSYTPDPNVDWEF